MSTENTVLSAADRLWNRLVESQPGPEREDLIELLERVPELRERIWDRLVKWGYLDPHNLVRVMTLAPALHPKFGEYISHYHPRAGQLFWIANECEPLRADALNFIFQQGPDLWSLSHTIENFPEMRERAWNELKERGANRRVLRKLICSYRYSSAVRSYAAKTLLSSWRTHNDLGVLVRRVKSYRLRAASLILETRPSNRELDERSQRLAEIVRFVPELRLRAWEMMTDPPPYLLAKIIKHAGELQATIGRLILDSSTSTEREIAAVVAFCEPLRDEAWQKLASMPIDRKSMVLVAENVEALRAEACAKILSTEPTRSERWAMSKNNEVTDLLTDLPAPERTGDVVQEILREFGPR